MGVGDELMASGMARGAHERGKKIAFGDGHKILWGKNAAEIFRGNPNVARPGGERVQVRDLEWIRHYAGRRLYNRLEGNRWVWNYEFKPTPGEIFFDDAERKFAENIKPGFVLIEPHVPRQKSVAPNKDWGFARYQSVADHLAQSGVRVCQLEYGKGMGKLRGVEPIASRSFRHGLAALSRAALYVGPEGGLHHGAAAVSVAGVVIFGGFIPPAVTGYDTHTNLTGGAKACGSIRPCDHCAAALAAITVDQVYAAAKARL